MRSSIVKSDAKWRCRVTTQGSDDDIDLRSSHGFDLAIVTEWFAKTYNHQMELVRFFMAPALAVVRHVFWQPSGLNVDMHARRFSLFSSEPWGRALTYFRCNRSKDRKVFGLSPPTAEATRMCLTASIDAHGRDSNPTSRVEQKGVGLTLVSQKSSRNDL